MKLRRCLRKESKETGRKGIYRQTGYLVNRYTGQNKVRRAVLAELGRIRQTWQNLAEVTDVADVVDIAVETGRQNMAECSGIWWRTANCRRLP